MARTKVVNPRRKKRRKRKNPTPRRRPAKRHGNAARNPRRRRRRSAKRRKRNPQPRRYSPYRMSNPRGGGLFDLDYLMDTVPAATLGVWLARWAIKMAGPLELDAAGNKRPGIKHGIFAYLAARFGGDMIGNFFGAERAGDVSQIAAYGYLGDLWARTYFFTEPDSWYRQNLYLGAGDYPGPYGKQYLGQGQAQQGTTFADATGRRYVKGPRGWQLAGVGAQPYAYEGQTVPGMGAQPHAYEGMGGFSAQSALGGFSAQSALGTGVGPMTPEGYMQTSRGYDSGRTISGVGREPHWRELETEEHRRRGMGMAHQYEFGGMYGRR